MSYKKEHLELKSNGVKTVILNGFTEDIDYVITLANLNKIYFNCYETI